MQLHHSTSARQSPLYWGLLLISLFLGGICLSIDPATNCDAAGNCAPWLIPVGVAVSLAFLVLSLSALIRNPHFGYRIEVAEARFYWWAGQFTINEQMVPIGSIAQIRLRCRDEQPDELIFYGHNGEQLPIPSTGIYPGIAQAWQAEFGRLFPWVSLVIEK